jgi:hypothetical protein
VDRENREYCDLGPSWVSSWPLGTPPHECNPGNPFNPTLTGDLNNPPGT